MQAENESGGSKTVKLALRVGEMETAVGQIRIPKNEAEATGPRKDLYRSLPKSTTLRK